MNALNRIARTAATILILSMALAGLATGSDHVLPSRSASDPHLSEPGQFPPEDISGKEIALSGAQLLLKNTRIGTDLDLYRQRLIRHSRFEYGKTIPPESRPPDGSKPPPKGIRFSGGLDNSLTPVVEFDSRLKSFDFSSTFHLMDHELECDISSGPLNSLIGGRAGISLRSDGSDSEAILQVKFNF